MRNKLWQILVDAITEVDGRVYEPSVAGPDSKKPYLIIREGVQDAGDLYANFSTIMEVWPYVKQTSFRHVDTLSQKVIDTFHRIRFDSVEGEPFYIEYLGSIGSDYVDEEWKALTRGLRFQVYSLAWLTGQTVEPDPVVAMQNWTTKRFPGIQVDPLGWSPSDTRPSLYWRLSNVNGIEPTNWGAWLDGRLIGHLIAPQVNTRTKWIKQVVQQLSLDNRAYLLDNSPLFFQSISADSTADPFRSGQIQLNVRFGVLKSPSLVEKIKVMHVKTTDGAGGVVK